MNDLEFTIRQLRKRPGFALAVMLTLAVGLGSATVVLAIANAVLYRLVASQLYQVQASDPLVCGGSVLLLIAAAAAACWVPARRAARTDPMVTLRCE